MNCPYCGNALEEVDEYRLYCGECCKTFTEAKPCPRCASEILEILGKNKLLCPKPECPSRLPITFSSPPQLRDILVPHNAPPSAPKSKSDSSQLVQDGLFAFCRKWTGKEELDIIIELPEKTQSPHEFAWHYDPAACTLLITNQIVGEPLKCEIVLNELRLGAIADIHNKKSVRRYLIITFILKAQDSLAQTSASS